ncbi:hypothetical protein [Colwellia psychrerythraea]|uniref:Uncharacterized protein n=1 Tax=Colwellia psychrerythraea TaxID=28229 RepID=A0A099KCA8_COLPS|nr:hypothetical protein [Colwellia psychrerythraea]KGJ87637.1 hypothetical protein ND2E_4375 [Colwellia psychrerythraea]
MKEQVNVSTVNEHELAIIKEALRSYVYFLSDILVIRFGLHYLIRLNEHSIFFGCITDCLYEIKEERKKLGELSELYFSNKFETKPHMDSVGKIINNFIFNALASKPCTKDIYTYQARAIKNKDIEDRSKEQSLWESLYHNNLTFFKSVNSRVASLRKFNTRCDFFYKRNSKIDWLKHFKDKPFSKDIINAYSYYSGLLDEIELFTNKNTENDFIKFLIKVGSLDKNFPYYANSSPVEQNLQTLIDKSPSKEDFLKKMDGFYAQLKHNKSLLLSESKAFRDFYKDNRCFIKDKKKLRNNLIAIYVILKEEEMQIEKKSQLAISVDSIFKQSSEDEKTFLNFGEFSPDYITRIKQKLISSFNTKDGANILVQNDKYAQAIKTQYPFIEKFALFRTKWFQYHPVGLIRQ